MKWSWVKKGGDWKLAGNSNNKVAGNYNNKLAGNYNNKISYMKTRKWH